MDLESIFRLEYYVKNGFPTTQINNTIKYFINLLNDITDEDEAILDDYVSVINKIEPLIRENSTIELFGDFKKKTFKTYVLIILAQIDDDYTYNYALKRYKKYPFYKSLEFNATYKICKKILKNYKTMKKKDIALIEEYHPILKVNKKAYEEVLEYLNYFEGKNLFYSNNYVRNIKLAKKYLLLCKNNLKDEAQFLIAKIENEEKEIELELEKERERLRIENEEKRKREIARQEQLRVIEEQNRIERERLEEERRIQELELAQRKRQETINNLINENSNYDPSIFRNNSDYIPYEYFQLKKQLKNNEFYHTTVLENAVSIINNRSIYSRELSRKLNILKFDNMENNSTSNSVNSSNFSSKTHKYARFYLNPINKAMWNFLYDWKNNNKIPVAFAIDFTFLYKYSKPIIISPKSAHYLEDEEFDWRRYNINNINILRNMSFNKFKFDITYQRYDRNADDDFKNYQMAEILVYENVPLNCISHIYFAEENHYNIFMSKLSNEEKKIIRDICVICPIIFGRY